MSWIIPALALGLLAWIAIHDIRHYEITNWSVLVLAALFPAYAVSLGAPQVVLAHTLFAVLVFMALLVPFHFNWMGGGDVKILTAAFLWTGLGCAFSFAVVLCAAILVHAGLVRFGLASTKGEGRARKIPFGPAVAAALALTLVLCVPISLSGRTM